MTHSKFFYVEVRNAAGRVLDQIETEIAYRIDRDGGLDLIRVEKEGAECWPVPETAMLEAVGKEALSQIDERSGWTGWQAEAIDEALEIERDMAADYRREDRAAALSPA